MTERPDDPIPPGVFSPADELPPPGGPSDAPDLEDSGELPAEREPGIWEDLGIWGPVSLLLTIICTLAYVFIVPPAPPRRFHIAAGSERGAYTAFARRYQAVLAEEGFELVVETTEGSMDNLAMLMSGEVPLALVQGGTAREVEGADRELRALASVFYEPLWIFHRGDRPFRKVHRLEGLRLALGTPGSGTLVIAQQVLLAAGVDADPERHLALGGREAAQALARGEIDGVFLVGSPRSKLVRELLTTPQVHLLDFQRDRAWRAQFNYLSSVHLPQGICDLEADLPEQDTTLLAPTANLVVRKDAHPALTFLLLKAATEVHREGGLLEDLGEFPSERHLELPQSEQARRFLEGGPNILYRLFPFWLADVLDRLKIMLLPVLTLLIPLIKVAPPLYRWRIRSKIYRWYRVLREIDQDLMELGDEIQPRAYRKRLRRLERELDKVSVPLSYMEEFYNLRVHIALIRQFIDKRKGPGPA